MKKCYSLLRLVVLKVRYWPTRYERLQFSADVSAFRVHFQTFSHALSDSPQKVEENRGIIYGICMCRSRVIKLQSFQKTAESAKNDDQIFKQKPEHFDHITIS